MKWKKIRQPDHAKVESILTRFQEKMKPLQAQLEAEMIRVQEAVAAEKQKQEKA